MDQPVDPVPRDAVEHAQFLAGEREVERHSAELKKELSLPNLVFTQVLSILGLAWIGTAGKLGSSHVVFWIAGIVLFYIPSAMVVIHLNNEMPLEGGLYQWAKLRFNEMTGFLVALNMWIYSIVFVSQMGVLVTNNLAYALGPSWAWLADDKLAIAIANVTVTAGLVLIARRGLGIGKWIHGFAGFAILFLFAVMVCFALPRLVTGVVAHPPLALTIPAFTLININILGKMGFGAFGGFDTAAVFAGECRDPDVAAVIRRSVWIATPLIGGAFVLGTMCVLVFVKPGDIDLMSPVTQVLNRGLQAAGISGSATSLVGGFIVFTLIGQAVLSFNYCARLPMVAGWDHILPEWFTRLHLKYKTPGGSIALIAGTTLVIAALSSMGAGNQEAYQIMQSGSGIAYGLAYLVMFAIPLAARGEKSSWMLRLAAVSGFAMTLLNVVLSIFPIIDVRNAASFAIKTGALVIVLNLAGALYYRRAESRRKNNLMPAGILE